MNFTSNVSFTTVSELNEQMLKVVLPVTVFVWTEAIVGFVGNILIIYVYYRSYEHCNFRYFVLFLAVYDLTSCLTTLPGELYAHFNWYSYQYDWMCKIKSFFNVFTAWGSAFTLLILAFDRCRKVCRPLGWQMHCDAAIKLCASGLILSILVSCPILFLWGKQTYTIQDLGLNVSICEKSGLYADKNYPFIYITCVYIVPVGSMMVVIIICNVLLARQLFCRMSDNKHAGPTFRIKRTVSQSSTTCVTNLSIASSEIHNTRSLMVTDNVSNTSTSTDQQTCFSHANGIGAQTTRKRQLKKCLSWGFGEFNHDYSSQRSVSALVIGMKFKRSTSVTNFGEIHRQLSCANIPGKQSAPLYSGVFENESNNSLNTNITTEGNNTDHSGIKVCQNRSNITLTSTNSTDTDGSIHSFPTTKRVRKYGYSKSFYSDNNIYIKHNQSKGSKKNVRKDSHMNCNKSSRSKSFSTGGKKSSLSCRKSSHSVGGVQRRIQKTWIILILTSVYIITTTVYITLVSRIAEKDGILKRLSDSDKAIYFFFLRLYFINSVINPILYGLMDPRFRAGVKLLFSPTAK